MKKLAVLLVLAPVILLAQPREVGRLYDFNGSTISDVAVSGNKAVVAASAEGIRVLDVSDPADPIETGSIWCGWSPVKVEFDGDIAVTVSSVGSIAVFDVSRMEDPRLHCVLSLPENNLAVVNMALYQNYLFLHLNDDSIHIWDCGSQVRPHQVSSFDPLGWFSQIEGDKIFFSAGQVSLVEYGLSDPLHPHFLRWISRCRYGQTRISGKYAHVIEDADVFNYCIEHTYLMFDIAQGDTATRYACTGLEDDGYWGRFSLYAVSGPVAVIYDNGSSQIIVVDGSRGNQSLISQLENVRPATGVALNGNLAYFAQGTSLGIYDFTGYLDAPLESSPPLPQEVALNAFPNPFNSTATISYSLPLAGRVTLTVYDLSGRLVETLVEGEMPVGRHEAVWEAKNVAAGVYVCQMQTPEATSMSKMTLLR